MTLAAMVLIQVLVAQPVDRTKPPETPPLAPYKLPVAREWKLSNGLGVLLVEDRRFPIVTLRMVFPAGSFTDPKEKFGLAETAASLLKEGTAKRTSRQIAEELASLGATLSAQSGADSLTVAGSVLAENTAQLLGIAGDIVRNAMFPQEEVDLRKKNRIQELALERSQSGTLGDEKLRKVVFGGHPYARTLPTPESIQSVTREDLLRYRNERLTPRNTTLILVGALPANTDALLKRNFESWPSRQPPPRPLVAIPPPSRGITLIDRPGSAQVDIVTGHVTVNRMHTDFFPIVAGHTILGGGASSRLFLNLREKEGFAYHANTIHIPMKESGILMAMTQVREEVLEQALTALFAEMDRMGKEPVTARELSATKNYLNGFFVLGLSDQNGVATQLAMLSSAGVPNSYLETYVTRIRSVEPEQIQKVAAKYLSPADTSIVIVGDASRIASKVEKFGKVAREKAP